MGADGKVSIVTGAASGIGLAIAKVLAKEGGHVSLWDIDEARGAAAAAELDASFYRCDVSNPEQVAAGVEDAVAKYGRLDNLFNNAGRGHLGLCHETEPAVWHALFALNVHSVFYACNAAIPHMLRQGRGQIVNTASISGLFADFGMGLYNATKGAIVNYTRSLAIDYARDGIRVNAICPGPVDTPFSTPLHTIGAADYHQSKVPMGRYGTPEEIANVACFLASDQASYMTGSIVVADGGITAHSGQPNFTRLFRQAASADE